MKNYTLKIADFGASKDLSDPATSSQFTDYVGTRWYRAPELLLYSSQFSTPYSQAIDIFALGCLMLELYLGIPAFPGSNESDQLNKIFSVLGTPTQSQWPAGYQAAERKGVKFTQFNPVLLTQLIKRDISEEGIELLQGMLRFDPQQRFTATQCLNHPYFRDVQSYISVSNSRFPPGS
jgi:male germ cell-associated kinase